VIIPVEKPVENVDNYLNIFYVKILCKVNSMLIPCKNGELNLPFFT
jgi:hypothetical protein